MRLGIHPGLWCESHVTHREVPGQSEWLIVTHHHGFMAHLLTMKQKVAKSSVIQTHTQKKDVRTCSTVAVLSESRSGLIG